MTTMRLGVTRHGPRPPDARQFGKYDVLTRTGVPTRSTSKETRSSAVRMCDTVAVGAASTGAGAIRTDEPTFVPTLACSCARTRGQSRGPSAARRTLKSRSEDGRVGKEG